MNIKRSRLFVLLFYHISAPFATDGAVSKTQETATPVDNSATQGDIFVPSGFWMLGERHCLSKARSNFGGDWKKITFTKFLRVPVGQTFDRLRLALPFRLRRKVLFDTEKMTSVGIFYGFPTSDSPVIPFGKVLCFR